MGRWYASLGQQEEAEKVLSKLTSGEDETSLRAKLALAYQYKKNHDWDESLSFFKEVADSSELELSKEACIEAAKIYEHKKKDYPLALSYCERAILINEKENQTDREFDKRRFRLAGKITKFLNHK